MAEPISHAEMIAWCRSWVSDIERERASAAGADIAVLRALLAHLERTQPTDTQADLTERARALWKEIVRANGNDAVVRVIAAALQSEREAAAAEARRAALEECARWHDEKAETSLAGGAHERSAAHHRRLASPTPQEETR